MSRAFVKESDDAVVGLPDRPVSLHPNLVTEHGRLLIESAVSRFEAAAKAAIDRGDRQAEASAQREVRYWRARRKSAQVIGLGENKSRVFFGSTVTLRRQDGRYQTFQIVGEDEAEPATGSVSLRFPLGTRRLRSRSW